MWENAFHLFLLLVVANEEGVDVGADDDGGRGEEGANVVLAQLHNLQRQGDGHEDGVGEHQRKVTPPDGKDAQRAEENDHEAGVDEHGVVVFQLRLAKVPSANEHKDRADDDEGVGDDEDRFEHIEDRLQGGDVGAVVDGHGGALVWLRWWWRWLRW